MAEFRKGFGEQSLDIVILLEFGCDAFGDVRLGEITRRLSVSSDESSVDATGKVFCDLVQILLLVESP